MGKVSKKSTRSATDKTEDVVDPELPVVKKSKPRIRPRKEQE